ncbi:MAG: tyrosine-type recombinase/integrase [Streptosporangiaceae bacterium]
MIIPHLRRHLEQFAADGDSALAFTSPTGQPLRHGHFRTRVWKKALAAAGLPDMHFHDLRHTGNDLAVSTGASLRDLMDRMGHSTTRAALIYQHRSDKRQHAIADALSDLAVAELKRRAEDLRGTPRRRASGTQRARRPGNGAKAE